MKDMKYLPDDLSYPKNEKQKLGALKKLFQEWHSQFERKGSPEVQGMVFDGFYPYYLSQTKKILFIGWEALGMPCDNYINVICDCYNHNDPIGVGPNPKKLNAHLFHSRMLYLAYGILNKMPAWADIPFAEEIGKNVGKRGGVSFAFMNISKASNTSGDHTANRSVINEAYSLSTKPRNFIQEEIAILEPDIIIAMNLGEKLASLGPLTAIHPRKYPNAFWLALENHRPLLIETPHFSARKGGEKFFYIPVCKAIQRSKGGKPNGAGPLKRG